MEVLKNQTNSQCHQWLLPKLYQQDLFSPEAIRHNYSTRNAESNGLYVPKVRTEKGKKGISYKGSSLWNGLPERLHDEPP